MVEYLVVSGAELLAETGDWQAGRQAGNCDPTTQENKIRSEARTQSLG